MHILCSDLEGVFVPEIWIQVAEKTGIEELSLTTRDIADYDVLMQKRLAAIHRHGLRLRDITDVIAAMDPLPGALDFLNWLRARLPVIIVSDTYTQFAGPLMAKLGWPALFCHTLVVDADGVIENYRLRQKDSKRSAVLALKGLNYTVIAMGDSYNDVSMLKEADHGIFFRPPANVTEDFPDLPVTEDYETLKRLLEPIFSRAQ